MPTHFCTANPCPTCHSSFTHWSPPPIGVVVYPATTGVTGTSTFTFKPTPAAERFSILARIRRRLGKA